MKSITDICGSWMIDLNDFCDFVTFLVWLFGCLVQKCLGNYGMIAKKLNHSRFPQDESYRLL